MFLMENEMKMSDIWSAYLSAVPRSEWSMYIHLPPHQNHHVVPRFFRKFVLGKQKRVPSLYCLDLISPTVALLKQALIDPSNAMFVLVSPAHIPVKPFPLLRTLLLRDGNSWLCLTDLRQWHGMEPGREQPKHHQWLALNRAEAERQAAAPHRHSQQRPRHGCWDEAWIWPPAANLSAADIERDGGRPWPGMNGGFLHTRDVPGLHGRCTTYTHWPGPCTRVPPACNARVDPFHAVEERFGDTAVGPRHEMLSTSYCALELLARGTDFLFARKFSPGALVSHRCRGGEARQENISAALVRIGVLTQLPWQHAAP